jgi:predicted dinucleotide-binding enzyme
MKIAIIGAGRVGTTLGDGWTKKGHTIVYGSRDPAKTSIRDAVAQSEVAVLTTPYPGGLDSVAAAGDFGGKPLIDATNPMGGALPGTSGAETVAAKAKNAKVVKAFNTTGLENMADPRYGEHRVFMPVASDDAGAREVALKLATDLGFDAVSVGGLSRARQLEPMAGLWIKLAMQLGHGRGIAFGMLRRTQTMISIKKKTAAPQRIVVVGGGHIGGGLAQAWKRAGHTVTVTDRASTAGAASKGDVIALAVPAGAAAAAAQALGDLSGKIIIDATNAIAAGFQLQYSGNTSGAEELQKQLGGARVVKSFNQQGAELLTAPVFDGVPSTNFVAGDDAEARKVVAALSDDIGFESLDAGPLSAARQLEALTLVWIAAAQTLKTRELGFKLMRR